MTTFQRKIFVLLLAVIGAGMGSGSAQTPEEGLAAMQLENWDKAIKVYSALTKKDPTDQPAWLTLGNAFLAKGDKEKAKETFDAAFNAKSEGPYAMIASGRILLLQGKQTEADGIFNKADKYGKKDIVTKRLIGESFLYATPGTKPNFARAEEGLKKAMELSSKDFATLMALAYCYKEMPNGGLAAQHYEYAVNIEPKNPLPMFMLAKVYKAAKLNDKFMVYVDKTIGLDPKYTQALRAKAEFLYYERQWEKATQAAKDLVNNGTEVTIEDEMLLANLLYITKDCKGCSELVDKILKKDGTKNYLRRLKVYCDYDNGKFKEGLDLMNEFFIQVPPEKILPSDYEYLGKLQIKNGRDTAAAFVNYYKTIQLDSSRWPLHQDMGDLYYQQKNYCKAAEEYKMNLDSVQGPNAMQYYRLGLCHYFCSDDTLHYSKAAQAFTKVTELAPDAGIGWAWLAKAMSKLEPDIVNHPELLEEFGKAKPYYDKFIQLGETDKEKNKKDLITSYEYLTSYYFLRKDDANAQAYLAKLLELDPNNETGAQIKTFLEGATPVPQPGGKGKGPNNH